MSDLRPPSRIPSPAPLYRRSPVRIACVQYDVKLGKVKDNVEKVERMTSGLQPGSVDLLVLPEMALSGYIFTSPTSILPYLEQPRIGPTSLLARSLARRLRCHVIAGYPEALPVQQSSTGTSISTAEDSRKDLARLTLDQGVDQGMEGNESEKGKEVANEGEGVGYNSAVVVGPTGEVVGNYRKTFRYDTDKNWAKEGDGFMHFDLPEPLGRVAVGICMDMNPKDFVAPFDAYELANYSRQNQVDMLVVPMNWLNPPPDPSAPEYPDEEETNDSPSESTLNYWAARLTPLHDPTPSYSSMIDNAGEQDVVPMGGTGGRNGKEGKEVVFVACNRVGTEEGIKFVGTSCVMTISSEPSRIELVECCTIAEERVMLATVT